MILLLSMDLELDSGVHPSSDLCDVTLRVALLAWQVT